MLSTRKQIIFIVGRCLVTVASLKFNLDKLKMNRHIVSKIDDSTATPMSNKTNKKSMNQQNNQNKHKNENNKGNLSEKNTHTSMYGQTKTLLIYK